MKNIFYVIAGAAISSIVYSGQTLAANLTKDVRVSLDPNQIMQNTFSNDVWMYNVDLEDIIILSPNKSYTINITFADMMHLELDDGFFDGNESIKIFVDGSAGTGGVPNNQADYEFLFTGVGGTKLEVNPVKGNATIGALNGDLAVDRDINLIKGGKMYFHDLHIKLTNRNVNPWAFDKIKVGVDADEIQIGMWTKVPEPTSTLSLLALSTLGAASTLKRKLKPSQSIENETTKVG